ncbi:hypothetical protein ACNO8X_19515 [Mycobacterium sp. PDNC021]|uniref:WXG100 family type VII secretion target n=1 Tax=Mycobacterium sp. PDNC021 TaxID=3391399 RepID=UPI003AB0DAC2
MSGVSGVGTPTRSQIESWDVGHLESAATHWSTTAEQWEGHFDSIQQGTLRPGGTTWEGHAADAAQDRAWADLVKVRGLADGLHSASGFARNGADDIAWAKRQAVSAINEAEEAGFTVGEDLSVTDRSVPSLLRDSQDRQTQAKEFAHDIQSKAHTLAAIDKEVAGKITGALAPLGEVTFTETVEHPVHKDHDGAAQAVDYHRFKESPPPPPGPNAADIRNVLEQLPKGSTDDIREVRSPEDLQKLQKWMTQDGTDGFNRYRDPAKGAWKDLPDGSKVGERFAANSTGKSALDIDLQSPDGAEHWKVHINPQTGGEPNIPAPRTAPVEPPKAPQAEPQAPKPAPPQAGPAEPRPAPPVEPGPAARPGPAVPIEGWGGPSAQPFGPQPVHPPGTINHPFPILGEDNPGENPRDFEGHH